MNLTEIAQEIRECVEQRKKELELTFYEDELMNMRPNYCWKNGKWREITLPT